MQVTKNSLGYCLLAILATTLWGSAFAGAKIGFEYMPPIMLSGVRFTLAGLLLVPMIFLLRISWKENMQHLWFMLLFGFIQTFLQYGIFFMGLNLVPGAISAIIIGAGPLFTAVLAHFTLHNDKFTGRKVFAVLLGVSGVVFISLSGSSLENTSEHFFGGVGLLILSNIIGSYTNIMVVKRKSSHISPVFLTMFANFTGGVMLLITGVIVEPFEATTSPLPTEFYFELLWLAIIPAGGFSIWYYLLSRPGVRVSELNVWKFLIPLVGVVLSWWLLPNESPSWSVAIGIAIILCSVVVLQLPISLSKKKNL